MKHGQTAGALAQTRRRDTTLRWSSLVVTGWFSLPWTRSERERKHHMSRCLTTWEKAVPF